MTLRNSYLLFTADFDGVGSARERGGRYFRAMFRGMPKEVQKVWTHCDGFENVDDEGRFVDAAVRCRCRNLREFIDYPEESLSSVLTALGSQRAMVDLVGCRGQGRSIESGQVLAFLDHQPVG